MATYISVVPAAKTVRNDYATINSGRPSHRRLFRRVEPGIANNGFFGKTGQAHELAVASHEWRGQSRRRANRANHRAITRFLRATARLCRISLLSRL
jgi:hypothetical protein